MIPHLPGGKALYIPDGVWVEAYERKKRRKRCSCGNPGEWLWRERTKHHWTPGEVVCSRCLIEEKLADQKERVNDFLRKLVVTAGGDRARLKKLSETVNVADDPPTLTPKGYWNLAHVVVITSKAGRRVQPLAQEKGDEEP
jgi:hypothetical protein